jgi:hypothetical protein
VDVKIRPIHRNLNLNTPTPNHDESDVGDTDLRLSKGKQNSDIQYQVDSFQDHSDIDV